MWVPLEVMVVDVEMQVGVVVAMVNSVGVVVAMVIEKGLNSNFGRGLSVVADNTG